MTLITWACLRYVQELATILGPQNRTQGSCEHLLRMPKEKSPTWNLVRLMSPTSWAFIFASVASVVLYFNFTSLMARKWMKMKLGTLQIDLYPFRQFLIFKKISFPCMLISV